MSGVHSIFGEIPEEEIERASLDRAKRLRDKIIKLCREEEDPMSVWSEDSFLLRVDTFRQHIGALSISLHRTLDSDIESALSISNSFWKCLWASLPPIKHRSLKYFSICGKPSHGYGSLVSFLANLAGKDVLSERWKLNSWDSYVGSVWKTKNSLAEKEKEKEYRDTAVVIAQIGIGLGGMLIGIIGLVVSAILTLFPLLG